MTRHKDLTMELQHINIKLLLKDPEAVDFGPLVPVFHAWIQNQVLGERLLDIADYRHVHHGPGIVLIGHEGDYSVDHTDGHLGVRYNRKAAFDGSNHDRLKQAARAALGACQRLESEPSLGGKLRFNGQDVEVLVNDRLLAPNNEASRTAADPDLRTFFNGLFRGAGYSLSYPEDSRRRFSASARASRTFSVEDLLANLPS
jgi:hypothetical protein